MVAFVRDSRLHLSHTLVYAREVIRKSAIFNRILYLRDLLVWHDNVVYVSTVSLVHRNILQFTQIISLM